jgi:hypothetical protein
MKSLQGKKCFSCGKQAQVWRLHKEPILPWCYRCRSDALDATREFYGKKKPAASKIKVAGFLGMDTETDKGKAVLICTSQDKDNTIIFPKSFQQIVNFLRGNRYLCWNANYDCQAIFKFLPRRVLKELATFCYVEWKFYAIRYVPNKFCHVRQGGNDCFTVFDLCQFYAKKLDTVARELFNEGKDDIPSEWYQEMRVGLQDHRKADIIKYCLQDARLVERIGKVTEKRFNGIGIDFSKPYSCASLAVKKFKTAMEHRIPASVNAYFRKSYRGGRFECLKIGHFKKAYLYDINSAYPSVMATMPAWQGEASSIGQFKSADEINRDIDKYAYAAVRVLLEIPETCPVPIVPIFRDEFATVVYPAGRFRAYVDKETFLRLREQGWIKKIYPEGYYLHYTEEAPPFAEMEEMYKVRKANPEHSWALKICMNASYGKLAQTMMKYKPSHRISSKTVWLYDRPYLSREQWTKQTNFVGASYITAKTRLKLWDVGSFKDIIFYATDGIASTKPLPLPDSKAMGQWGFKGIVRDLTVVGSGVYGYINPEGQPETHFRGFSIGINLLELLDTARVNIPLAMLRNTSLKQCFRNKDAWKMMNVLIEKERFLNVRFDQKRIWNAPNRCGRDLLNHRYESTPWVFYD